MDIIYTTYLTKKLDFSQHDSSNSGKGGSQPNDFNLICNWYNSVYSVCKKDSSVRAVIFHNECNEEFIDKYKTSFIHFIKWDSYVRPSYNDDRFYCFRQYLIDNSDVKRAISTDMFDVEILKNPFELMNKKLHYNLFCGSEEKSIPGSGSRRWVNNKIKKYNLPTINKDECVYNAGCCGGRRNDLICLYDRMIELFERIPKSENSNMAVFNASLKYLKENNKYKIFTGHPLHNVFQSFKADKETYIKHK